MRALKAEGDGTIAVLGSGVLVQQLTALDLVDGYRLFLHPLLLGEWQAPLQSSSTTPADCICSAWSRPAPVSSCSATTACDRAGADHEHDNDHESHATEERPGHITGLHTVGIPVTDQDRALAFYEALGFETRLDVPMGEGARWIEVAPPGAAVSLALEPAQPERPAGVETGIRLTTGDADAANAALRVARRRCRRRAALARRAADVRLPRSGRQRARDRRGLSTRPAGRRRS